MNFQATGLVHIPKMATTKAGSLALTFGRLSLTAGNRLLLQPKPSKWPSITTQFRRRLRTGRRVGVRLPSATVAKPTPVKLVIFDNNGTLTNFHPVWTPWVQALTKRLESFTGLPLRDRLYDSLGVCAFTHKTRSGVLAERTCAEIQSHLVAVLCNEGVPAERAVEAVRSSWRDCDLDTGSLQQVANLRDLFLDLTQRDIRVAICTSGTRNSTLRTLQMLHLQPLVATVMCGDDTNSLPKPNAHNVLTICDSLDISPRQTVMVGDTTADMQMACNAGTGLAVGVLTGIGTRLDLTAHTTNVIDNVADLAPIIARGIPPIGCASGLRRERPKASLVIFDKDGTLLCFHSMWTPWLYGLIERLEKRTGLRLYETVSAALGYDHVKRRWRTGIFAEGTGSQNRQRLRETLHAEGLTCNEAQKVVEYAWQDANHDGSDLRPLDQPVSIFRTLQRFGIKVAICTADSRYATRQFIRTIGACRYINAMSCGDDSNARPKPSPHNALRLCHVTRVAPKDAIVVGDTAADLGMGRAAGLGATVAVLSGVGGAKELGGQADHVVQSIGDVLPLVLTERQRRQVDL